MDFKLVSKNNMGLVITLILVILLSQSRFFDFLIDTHLGRMLLLSFVILIAYTNKILGLVAVLFIIIAYNNNDTNMVYGYNIYEGFDGSGNLTPANGVVRNDVKTKLQTLQQDISGNYVPPSTSTTTSTTTTSSSSTESFKGREGFCMSDRETNMLRGKQSNAVPVFNNLREQPEDVSPSDKSIFTSDFAAF